MLSDDLEARWTDNKFRSYEGKHQLECNCEQCHANHLESCEWASLAQGPDFRCCRDEMQNRIAAGQWCPRKPFEHGGAHIHGTFKRGKFIFEIPVRCGECENELAKESQKS